MTKQALVFANGDINDGPRVRQALASAPNALVIAADGGARIAAYFDRRIDLIIGDMDSVGEETLARLTAAGTEVEQYPAHKDHTDLELALMRAVERGVGWIRIIGGLGGRLDQSLSNVYLLALPLLKDCDVALVADGYEARLLLPGTTSINGAAGDTVSLIPLSGVVEHVRTENLEYALHDEDLYFGPARGISNVMNGPTAQVAFAGGALLLVHTLGHA